MSFTYIGTPERYRHTIQYAYAQRPDASEMDRHQWVAAFLMSSKHWDALEEHLQNVDAADRRVDRRERDRSRPPGATAPPLAPGTPSEEER